ncbi:hypothetical protein GCM10022261_16940 [Brevibacterium daeguense]|uniref:DUF2238 domain-containing protein n=1 Tax=Brevibacterium daeguense TaxID=909936 RepID=A0ABP8EJP1_9MICO|nr:hypothetical protein [Brevibacterium daeguense]
MNTLDSKRSTARRHAPLIVTEVILAAFALTAVFRGNGTEALLPSALFLAALVPLPVEKLAAVRIPLRLQLLYALLLLSGPFFGSHLHFYAVWSPWDTVVHFFSGFLIALAAVFALGVTIRRYRLVLPVWFEAAVVISVSASVAMLWEFAEFFADLTIGTSSQLTNTDTMTDMVVGTLSAVIVAAAFILYRQRGWFSAFAGLLGDPEITRESASSSPLTVEPRRSATVGDGRHGPTG